MIYSMENFRFLTFLSKVGILVLCIFSCQKKEHGNDLPKEFYSNYQVTLADSMLSANVRDYIKSNKIDPKTTFITIRIENSRHRTRFYISHSIFVIDDSNDSAIGHTIIEESLVLIYSDIEQYIHNAKILDELRQVVKERKIKLLKKSLTFDPPIWNIVKCGDRVIKGANSLAYDLPCGIKLGIDRKANKFIIEEEEWLKEARKKADNK